VQVALRRDHALDGVGAERADQLVLEIGVADGEAGPLQVGSEPGALEGGADPRRESAAIGW
jgi:hypothetical protein